MKDKIQTKLKMAQRSLLVALTFLSLSFFSHAVFSQAVHRSSDFNHMKTGFALTGAHIIVECESCHVGGIFKGTPKDCAGCHSLGRRVVAPPKNTNHIVTNLPCDSCHTNAVSFIGTRFNHIGVQPRSCLQCHNGIMAPGKPSGHPVTNSPCDSCHRPNTWLPAGFDHANVTPGTCANCHNGSDPNIVSKNLATHIVTTAACDTCHHNFNTFIGATFNHATAGVLPNQCGTCHIPGTNGAKTKPGNHIPTTGSLNACDVCHTTAAASYTSFFGPGASKAIIHANVNTASCKACHSSPTPYLVPSTFQSRQIGKHECSTNQPDCITCHINTYTNWKNPSGC